ncbi:MAG: hypothetical protein JSV34_04200 [Candidatus Omnitrophota bacterium]|nr:MAG: hypothetical protein JSV34_04200 [Candidatus Omnitrophota bacterium]
MKKFIIVIFILVLGFILFFLNIRKEDSYCLTGAFLSDKPTKEDIVNFKNTYGKKPFLVLVFVDWDNFVDEKVTEDVYSSGCILFVSWEPWYAHVKEGVDFDELLAGKHDGYIKEFASKIKGINKPVLIRFAHEMNGDWYPWAGIKVGADKFKAGYRYVKGIFDSENADNVKWVFSINWQNIPQENDYRLYYPQDENIDYIGIDGYNWGNTQSWSKWMSFEDIFSQKYTEITTNLKKPVIISEFSSTSSGGNKAMWIRKALIDMKKMENIKAFVLFNVDKETDWSFSINSLSGKELKKQLKDGYFKDGLVKGLR